MNIVICWSHISGYMAACWKALAACDGVRLSVIAISGNKPGDSISFNDDLMAGLDCRLVDDLSEAQASVIERFVADRKPDIVVIPGWFCPQYTRLATLPALSNAKFVMTMDTPYRGTLRQRLGRFRIASLLSRIDGVIVAGERAFQLARALRIPENKIMREVYGFDDSSLKKVFLERRSALQTGIAEAPLPSEFSDSALEAHPERFLFVGRYVEEKAIDILVDGYLTYRGTVHNPWPLTCCGRGPLAHLLKRDGIDDRGFIQPDDLPGVLREHGAYVLCSRYEPWGVALAEAMASGMPAIVTEACGASVELVRSQFNGLIIPTDDAKALANAFTAMQANATKFPDWSENARATATAFTSQIWATRWQGLFERLLR